MEQSLRILVRIWLLLGKFWSFAFIFAGGCLLATVILPLLSLLPGNQTERAQFLIHKVFRLYVRAMQALAWIDVEVLEAKRLSACTGQIIIANHPSLLDVMLLIAFIPRTQCIVKHQLWNSRLLGGLVRRAGYIRNDLGPEALIASCQASLDEGRCLIIFPEGTRTPLTVHPRFHRGFANVATLTGASIQPVFMSCDPPFLFKGEAWWRVPAVRPLFRIAMGEYIDANTYSLYGQRSLAVRKLVEVLEQSYATQVYHKRA